MSFVFNVNQNRQFLLTNAAITTTGSATVNSTVLDTANAEGQILLIVSARASGTGTMTIGVEHSFDNTTFVSVPAAALVDAITGDQATFDVVTTSASTQARALRTDLLRRYVRVTYTGTDLAHNVAAAAVITRKYTEDAS